MGSHVLLIWMLLTVTCLAVELWREWWYFKITQLTWAISNSVKIGYLRGLGCAHTTWKVLEKTSKQKYKFKKCFLLSLWFFLCYFCCTGLSSHHWVGSRGSHGSEGILWFWKLQLKLQRKEPEEFQQWMILLELRVNITDCKRDKRLCKCSCIFWRVCPGVFRIWHPVALSYFLQISILKVSVYGLIPKLLPFHCLI